MEREQDAHIVPISNQSRQVQQFSVDEGEELSAQPQKANPLPNFLLASAIKAIVLVIAQEPRNLVFIRKNITLLRTIPNGRNSQKA